MGLDLGLLQAGASVKGEFENRLKGVIAEVKGSAKPIILFIDEAHTIIGAGGPQGGGDAANLLKPALARGELRTIAATTWKEYKKYFEKDAALERRFQPVKVDEPDEKTATTMLRGLRPKFEEAHNVIITDDAVTAAVRLSARYISGRQLPDKAVDLLDTCCGARQGRAPAEARRHRGRRGADPRPSRTELDALAPRRRQGRRRSTPSASPSSRRSAPRPRTSSPPLEAAFNDGEGGRRQGRGGAQEDGRRQDRRGARRRSARRSSPPSTRSTRARARCRWSGPTSTSRWSRTVVAAWTGIPVGKMVQDDVKNLLEMEDRLNRRIKGQDYGIHTIAKELRAARAGPQAAATRRRACSSSSAPPASARRRRRSASPT